MHRLTTLLAALLLLTACRNSAKVLQSQLAPGTDLTAYKTYGFYDIDSEGVTDRATYEQNLELLKNAIRKEMNSRGFTESSNPDLKINIGIVIAEKEQTRQTDFRTDRPRYIGQRNYSWKSEEVVVGYYKEGTMDLHLVDAANNRMVWQGTVRDILPAKARNMGETVDRGVQTLFAKFPVKRR